MLRPIPAAIGLRYLRAKRRNGFISFISLASILGIAIGVTVLITTLAVMSGFQKEIRDRMLGMVAHATISADGDTLSNWQRAVDVAREDPRVAGAAPYVDTQALLRGRRNEPAAVRAIVPEDEAQVSDLTTSMVIGKLEDLQPGTFNIVLGRELALWLGVGVGDSVIVSTDDEEIATVARQCGAQVPFMRPPELSASVRRALADVAIGEGEDDPALDEGWGEPGLSAAERLIGWNTLEVLALGAGTPQRPINAIPAEAVAHCQLRFVVGTPWRQVAELVREHLAAHGFGQIEVTVTLEGAATRLDVDDPWVEWASGSIARSVGQTPTVLPNLAGSLPNDVFSDLLGLPTLWVPHSYAACAQHAPNEHLLAPVAREGLQLMAGLFWDLGEPNGAPWRRNTPTHASPL